MLPEVAPVVDVELAAVLLGEVLVDELAYVESGDVVDAACVFSVFACVFCVFCVSGFAVLAVEVELCAATVPEVLAYVES